MTALASSDVTVTVLDRQNVNNRMLKNLVKVQFGDSALTYPSGGVSLPAASKFGLRRPLQALIPIQDRNLTSLVEWRHDYASATLRGYGTGHVPSIVIDEAVTLTSNAGTLKYLPAYILTTRGTVSAATVPLKVVPHTITVGTQEMTVNWTTGAVTTKATDSVTGLLVSYIPQQPSGFFSQANMVINESVTLSEDKVNFAHRAAALQYVYQTTATAARLVLGHAVASGVVLLDIADSGNTSLDCHADNAAKAAVVTYLKYAGLENSAAVRFTDQAQIALTSEAKEWGKTAGDLTNGLVIPGTGTQIIGAETTNYLPIWLMDGGATDGPGKATFNIMQQKIITDETAGQTSIEDTPLLFYSPLLQRTGGLAELTTNDAPTATTLYFYAIG